jgi:hypothetical protein
MQRFDVEADDALGDNEGEVGRRDDVRGHEEVRHAESHAR